MATELRTNVSYPLLYFSSSAVFLIPIKRKKWFIPLKTEVYFCHQNQNAKNIGNFTTPLKPHNIGTHLKGIGTSFQVVLLFFNLSIDGQVISLFEISQNTFSLSLKGLENCKHYIIYKYFLR
jgi:hypothetical protein